MALEGTPVSIGHTYYGDLPYFRTEYLINLATEILTDLFLGDQEVFLSYNAEIQYVLFAPIKNNQDSSAHQQMFFTLPNSLETGQGVIQKLC